MSTETDFKQAVVAERNKRIDAVIDLAKQLLVHQPEEYNIMLSSAEKDAITTATRIMGTLNYYRDDMRNNTDNDI